MSTPPGKQVWEGGDSKGSKEEELVGEERSKEEEELKRRKEEGDSATLHQYAQGLYFVQK